MLGGPLVRVRTTSYSLQSSLIGSDTPNPGPAASCCCAARPAPPRCAAEGCGGAAPVRFLQTCALRGEPCGVYSPLKRQKALKTNHDPHVT